MLRVSVSQDMMANLRFAYSPLLELTISYRVLGGNWKRAIYWRWIEEAQGAIHDIDLPYMNALITAGFVHQNQLLCSGYLPDFLTPTPLTPVTDIEEDFDRLLNTDHDIVRQGLHVMVEHFGPNDLLCDFIAHPQIHMPKLVEELREYWNRTLAHHWNRMRSVLENDMLHHSRLLTLHGAEALFPQIDNTLEYETGMVIFNDERKKTEVSKPYKKKKQLAYNLDANSLHLVPVIFSANQVYHQFVEPWQPMIVYTSRGAALWNYESPEPSAALELTLGAGKSRLILALDTPLSSGEIARKLSLTAGAVSQQLGKLHQAGLVESHRSGKHVFYRLSERGHKLVELFATTA